MNHGTRRTHLSRNRLLTERGSRGVQRRATRTKGGEKKRREGEECMFAMTYLMIIVMAAVIGGGGVLSCSLSHSAVSHKLDGCLCPLQAA